MVDQPPPPPLNAGIWPRRPGHRVLVVVAAVAIGLFIYHKEHSSTHAPDPAQLAAKVGALDCTAESYYIENRLDHTKTPLFSCDMGTRTICVVEESGLARNVTAEARLLFADTLGGQKPSCIAG